MVDLDFNPVTVTSQRDYHRPFSSIYPVLKSRLAKIEYKICGNTGDILTQNLEIGPDLGHIALQTFLLNWNPLNHPEFVVAAYFLPERVGEGMQIESLGGECGGIFSGDRTVLLESLHNKLTQIVPRPDDAAEGFNRRRKSTSGFISEPSQNRKKFTREICVARILESFTNHVNNRLNKCDSIIMLRFDRKCCIRSPPFQVGLRQE
jgi:hypothetical protein